MTESKIRINETLFNIFKEANQIKFSTLGLKELLFKHHPEMTSKQASQIAHRTLKKMLTIGFFSRSKDKNIIVFLKTSSFDINRLTASKPRHQDNSIELQKSNNIDVLRHLKATLNQYQIDLLSHIGEAEEFNRLFKAYPEAKKALYDRYMAARNESSSMLGKIKAVETCISALEG
ncbi:MULTISPECIES: hypothetical protein [Pseudomonadati]|uniref:Response regulator n=1 Tax=Shewanella aestuarii TaxID=1028752 RepID=A0ABT0L492_9GAMM|nr:hypothetical protein [Shewanella aestuarii]MCL1118315.1 hypothetical protein [Shewanella aestuarii]GGN80470.1 hypothetical protein GCM10009193_25700 [Shewanella aestuarii]